MSISIVICLDRQTGESAQISEYHYHHHHRHSLVYIMFAILFLTACIMFLANFRLHFHRLPIAWFDFPGVWHTRRFCFTNPNLSQFEMKSFFFTLIIIYDCNQFWILLLISFTMGEDVAGDTKAGETNGQIRANKDNNNGSRSRPADNEWHEYHGKLLRMIKKEVCQWFQPSLPNIHNSERVATLSRSNKSWKRRSPGSSCTKTAEALFRYAVIN